MKKILFLFSFFALVSCNVQNAQTPTEMPLESTERAVTKEMPEPAPSDVENIQNTDSYADIIAKASNKLTQSQPFQACMKTYTNVCINEAANVLAEKENDMSICDELSEEKDNPQRSACKFGMIMRESDKLENTEQCNIIHDEYLKNVCKKTVLSMQALKAKDVKMCDAIVELFEDEKERAEGEKEGCIFSIITEKEGFTSKDCDILGTEHIKMACQEFAKNPQ